jgi:four helix bundle protein
MAGVRRFEDLECHQLAVQVRREVLRLTRRESVRREWRYVQQIRDAARSAPRNIAEGYARFNPSETVPYLNTVRGSLDEVRDEIMDGHESGYFGEHETNLVLELARRAIGATLRWKQYLESPQARRFYEQHKAKRRAQDFRPRTRT